MTDARHLARLSILADDLTGAADCAASFTGAVGPVPVLLAPDATIRHGPSALDLDTRALDAFGAQRAWADTHTAGTLPFKKIDSTLRGHIGVELAAMLRNAPAPQTVVVAPAFPQQGRTLVGGRLHVHGEARDADLVALLAAGLGGAAEVAPLAADARLDPLARTSARHRVFACDARDDARLEAIAAAGLAAPRVPWFVGAAGLARALAGAPPRVVALAGGGTTLVLVGSFSPAARAQVQALRAHGSGARVAHLPFHEGAPPVPSRARVRALAESVRDALAACTTLIVTGGDTARAALHVLGVDRFTVEGEAEPGVPVATIPGKRLVLKAGAFGDNEVLLRLIGDR